VIETIDDDVRAWLASVAGSMAAISFDLPPPTGEQLTLHAYLFDIDRPLAVSSGRLPPMLLRLGYIVTCSGPDVPAAHAVLSKLIAAAETNAQFSLEFGPAVAAAWTALHVPARAGFVLRATASKERAGQIAPPVRGARLETVSLQPLSGRVTAKDGTPLAGATIEASSIGRTATTDADGRFTLEGATNALDLSLRVRAKGSETEVTHAAHSTGDYTIAVDVTK
jgi:hypothetical protein